MNPITKPPEVLAPKEEIDIRAHLGPIIDAIADALVCLTTRGAIVHLNPAAEKLFGYAAAELPGLDFKALIHPRDHDLFDLAAADLFSPEPSAKEQRLKTLGLRKGGREFPVDMFLTQVAIGGQKAITVLVKDIAARNALDAVNRSEKAHRSLVHNLPGALVLLDLDGNIVFINQRAADLLGVARATNQSFFEFVAPEEHERVASGLRQAGGAGSVDITYAMVRSDGSRLSVKLWASPYLDIQGQSKGVLAVVRVPDKHDPESELAASFARLKNTLVDTVDAVSSIIKMKDPYVADHQERVTRLACAIADEMALSELTDGIRVAGHFHDVGKLLIPMQILSKPGKLTPEEFAIVKRHIRMSHEIINAIDFPWPVAEAVFQHHERLDGSGYPEGIKAPDITIEARVLAVADVVEAMSSRRPYRAGLGIDAALDELAKNRAVLYDSEVAQCCIRLFREKRFIFI